MIGNMSQFCLLVNSFFFTDTPSRLHGALRYLGQESQGALCDSLFAY